ncbi:streptococcal hemagglutinin-like [Amphibalanus amphitrite]|uniref:streptococcal hemagglutinin-like n=1 Tax=Amphibalanus amphitrite TaxID=1232801 RepID=UPI001C926EFF|nr:streptococcal hemagglutinin-like [Amphibalanus amphitrite]
MAAAFYSRRGFRVRLILEEYDDHRKKCYFFINVIRQKFVRNVMQRIWYLFYKEKCSSHDDIFLEIDGFFLPPGESTLVLKENDIISVRVRPGPATSALTPSASAVRSIVAPLTASPVTLVESVAHVLRRLQNGGGPEDSERLERDRLVKVAEMMAAESGSTDESTDEDDVRDLASQLTSRKEVVRLSQKMVDQATPPPPCAAKKHNLDSEHLTLTEVSRELRRRYDAANDLLSTSTSAGVGTTPDGTSTTPGTSATSASTTATPSGVGAAAATKPAMSKSTSDLPEAMLKPVKQLEASVKTSEMRTEAPSGSKVNRSATAEPRAVREPTGERHGVKGSREVERLTRRSTKGVEETDDETAKFGGAGVKGTAGTKPKIRKVMLREGKVVVVDEVDYEQFIDPENEEKETHDKPARVPLPTHIVPLPSRNAERSSEQSGRVSEVSSARVGPGPNVAKMRPKIIVVCRKGARSQAEVKAGADEKTVSPAAGASVDTERPNASEWDVRTSPEEQEAVTTVKGGTLSSENGNECEDSKIGSSVETVCRKNSRAPVGGVKRARSSSRDSSGASSASEEDTPNKSTPVKKPVADTNTTTTNTSEGASTEKKKRTRTRRRRGRKRRTPEAPPELPPPPPQPQLQSRGADYAQRHGLPRGEIDRYKRAASVSIGWQTRPKNRRVVFDDDGNPVPYGAEPSPQAGTESAGREWRATAVTTQGNGQWAWSQGRNQELRTDGDDPAARCESLQPADRPMNLDSSQPDDRSDNVSKPVSDSARPPEVVETTSEAPRRESDPAPSSASDSRLETQAKSTTSEAVTKSGSTQPAEKAEDTQMREPSNLARDTPSSSYAARAGQPALGGGGSRRGGSLGAGLLPRAFMRPRRCVDPPRRSEVLGKPTETTTMPRGTSDVRRGGFFRSSASPAGSDRLLQPSYLIASREAAAAGRTALPDTKTTSNSEDGCAAQSSRGGSGSDVHVSSDASRICGAPRDQRASTEPSPADPQTPASKEKCSSALVGGTPVSTSANPAAADVTPIISSAPASAPSLAPVSSVGRATPAATSSPAPPSHTTVVLDGRGRPAEGSAGRDLRHLATSTERRPLVVVRQDRPLPGRTPYREVTKHESRTSRKETGDVVQRKKPDANISLRSVPSSKNSKESGGQGKKKCDRDDRGGSGRREDGAAAAPDSDGDVEDDTTDATGSPSGDVYRNVSVILPGPPLEQLSPRADDSGESEEVSVYSDDSEEDADDAKDSEDEGDSVEELPDASNVQRGNASVDSITNCNVVNAVGQNRRLEKQRARGLPPGGGKENRAPADGVKDERFYAQFPLMKEVAHKGDLIAFKCWDMAADYSPFVSEYREATVMETGDGGRVTLQLLEYRPRGRRRGRFEITSPDDDEVVDLEEESGIEERCWSELIQPRLLHP